MMEAIDWLHTSYLYYRLQSNPDYYKSPSNSDMEFMSLLLMKSLKELVQIILYRPSFMLSTDDESMPLQDFSITNPQQFPFVRVNATSLGHIASFYYLSHLTIRSFLTSLSTNIEPVEAPDFGVTIDSLDCIYHQLALSTEYSLVPVRHNEDVEMMQWLKTIRRISFTDPYVCPSCSFPSFQDIHPSKITYPQSRTPHSRLLH